MTVAYTDYNPSCSSKCSAYWSDVPFLGLATAEMYVRLNLCKIHFQFHCADFIYAMSTYLYPFLVHEAV